MQVLPIYGVYRKPGYRHILIQPHPANRFSYAKAGFLSSYGQINSGWELKDGEITMHVTIPANTMATIILPGAKQAGVMESGRALGEGFKQVKQEGNDLSLETGSGDYTFTYKTDMTASK